MQYDNIHWDFREIDGYDCDFNFVISTREPGKTTALWHKARTVFERGHTFLYTTQQKVTISEVFFDSSLGVINKFIDDPKGKYNFFYNKGSIEKGIVDVWANTGYQPEKRLMFRCCAMSNKLSDMKSLFLPNCECHFMDEFIKNTRAGERYLPQEAFKYKELINTFQREAPNRRFKSYMFGNPYSRANPYFVEFGVDISKLKRGTIYRKGNVLVQCYEMKPELREYILKHNPLYQFDDSYTRYAFDGLAINDANMIIKEKQPVGFSLFCVVLIDGQKVGLYSATYANFDYLYWVGPVGDLAKTRVAYALNFSDLMQNTVLIDKYGKQLLSHFALAMQNRKVAFSNSQYGTWAENIYNYL